MRYPNSRAVNTTLVVTVAATALTLAASLALPREAAQLATLIALTILLPGTACLASLQGRRVAFLRRFVSPGVAAAIDRDGADALGDAAQTEISVVCADIRHFTRFAARTEPARVFEFLREYYDAVGAVVTAFGGTVKDYAGDGILVLVGAPRFMDDHAARAVAMAQAMRDAAERVTARWSCDGLALGVGIGVASGEVAVGLIGGRERLEFAAVGPAVNLAARLCGQAAASEILIDARARDLAGGARGTITHDAPRALTLKGLDATVPAFAV